MNHPTRPGGGRARSVRTLAPEVTVAREQRPVIDKRGRTGAVPGSEPLARSSQSGYTWLLTTGSHTANSVFSKNLWVSCTPTGYRQDGNIAAERMKMMASVQLTDTRYQGMGVALDDFRGSPCH